MIKMLKNFEKEIILKILNFMHFIEVLEFY